MTSPRDRDRTNDLLTSTRSPGSSVGSIDSDGMKKAWTTKVFRTIASTNASDDQDGELAQERQDAAVRAARSAAPARSSVNPGSGRLARPSPTGARVTA